MIAYIALLRKGPKTDYGVNFPDLPGLATAGRTLDEALARAGEALAFYLDSLAEEGAAIPAPSELETVMSDPENRDGVAVLLPAPAPKTRAVQVTITMDEKLLVAVNRRAENIGMTRSGFLAEGARRLLGPDPEAPKRPARIGLRRKRMPREARQRA